MTDNELIDILATQLEAASANAGWHYPVIQKDQPTPQGVPSGPSIFFEKISDHHYGFPMASNTYQATPDNFAQTDTQVMETTFQVSALVPQDPANLGLPTASDVANYMKMFIQHRNTIASFKAQSVGMLRVSEVRNPFFIDDRERFEADPNFDIVLTHNTALTLAVPAATSAVGAPSPIPGDNNVGLFPV